MRPARVIGRVMATVKDPSLRGQKLLILQRTDWNRNDLPERLVAADTVGSGFGEWVFYVESRDASHAVIKNPPVDAAIVGIIDGVELMDTEEL